LSKITFLWKSNFATPHQLLNYNYGDDSLTALAQTA